MTVPGILMIDRAGRRPLLIWGAVVSMSRNRYLASEYSLITFTYPSVRYGVLSVRCGLYELWVKLTFF